LFVLGWLLVLTNALEVASFPSVSPSLVAIKQKLKLKAANRQTSEAHQTRSLELEKLQLQRELDNAEEYRNKDKRWGFSGSVDVGGALSGAVSSGIQAATNFAKDQANNLIDKGKAFLGLNTPAPPPPEVPVVEEEVDNDCVEDCHDETEREEKRRLERQKIMHDRMDEAEKAREAREMEREQLEALREQELQEKIEQEEEKNKQNEEGKPAPPSPDDGDPDDEDDDGTYPTKPLRIRGKKRVCRDGNCWYAPTNIDTEGLDIETSADEKKILRDRIAGMVGQQREGFRDGFEQGVDELRYFKQGYNLGFKEAKEEELREQREEANRKPVIPLDPSLESQTQSIGDKVSGLVNGAISGGVNKITSAVDNVIGGLGAKVSGGFSIGGSLFIEEQETITKKKKYGGPVADSTPIPDA